MWTAATTRECYSWTKSSSAYLLVAFSTSFVVLSGVPKEFNMAWCFPLHALSFHCDPFRRFLSLGCCCFFFNAYSFTLFLTGLSLSSRPVPFTLSLPRLSPCTPFLPFTIPPSVVFFPCAPFCAFPFTLSLCSLFSLLHCCPFPRFS